MLLLELLVPVVGLLLLRCAVGLTRLGVLQALGPHRLLELLVLSLYI